VDVERRSPRRVGSGLDRYTSLSASADGRRLVATTASPKRTLWRLPLSGADAGAPTPVPIALTTGSGFSPRLGPGYLVYVTSKGDSDSIWRLADGRTRELWSAAGARIIGRPEIDEHGRRIAFTVEAQGRPTLHAMNADGTDARAVTESLDLRGAPAWAPGGEAITSAANVDGTPRLFRISLDGSVAPLASGYAVDPVWAPHGGFVVYSGPDAGTTFPILAIGADGARHPLPVISLTRGARRLRFLDGGRALVAMRGDLHHKDLWRIDLDTGAERPLTRLAPDFDLRDFDISPDGREIVLERVQEHSDVVLIETGAR
jgi:Tol biopolymer transport system component